MFLWIIIIAINLISVVFACITIGRIKYHYSNKFPLPESKYTLLFSFISINYATIAYAVFVLTVAAVSIVVTYLYG